MKVKSESEVAQSCPTLSDPMDWSLPGSSIHGIFQARVLEWGAVAFYYLCPSPHLLLWFLKQHPPPQEIMLEIKTKWFVPAINDQGHRHVDTEGEGRVEGIKEIRIDVYTLPCVK